MFQIKVDEKIARQKSKSSTYKVLDFDSESEQEDNGPESDAEEHEENLIQKDFRRQSQEGQDYYDDDYNISEQMDREERVSSSSEENDDSDDGEYENNDAPFFDNEPIPCQIFSYMLKFLREAFNV